jgi:hypothetical protein
MTMRINVGCGMTPTKDWVNFDNSFSLRLAKGGYLGVLVGALPLLTSPQRSFISFARCRYPLWRRDNRTPSAASICRSAL